MFKNREEAGEKLAQELKEELSSETLKDALVLGIPRGGIVVGIKVKRFLDIPFECLVTKKIPAPGEEELAIGAVAEGGVVVWEDELCQRLKVPVDYKQKIVKEKVAELEKKQKDFREEKPLPQIKDRVVIIVDDGVATGSTIKAAVAVVRSFSPKEIIVAVPVIAQDSLEDLKERADRIIYLEAPEMFFSVGQFYEKFEQLTDEQIKNYLAT